MPQVTPEIETFARIKVVGVGGAGGAAVNRMVEAGIKGVELTLMRRLFIILKQKIKFISVVTQREAWEQARIL